MAKKYLLYIHNDKEFDNVRYKSKLINTLLDKHFNNGIYKDVRSHKKIILDSYKEAKICSKGHFYSGSKCMQKGCQ